MTIFIYWFFLAWFSYTAIDFVCIITFVNPLGDEWSFWNKFQEIYLKFDTFYKRKFDLKTTVEVSFFYSYI